MVISSVVPGKTSIGTAQRVLDWVDYMGIQVITPPNDEHDPRQYIDQE